MKGLLVNAFNSVKAEKVVNVEQVLYEENPVQAVTVNCSQPIVGAENSVNSNNNLSAILDRLASLEQSYKRIESKIELELKSVRDAVLVQS